MNKEHVGFVFCRIECCVVSNIRKLHKHAFCNKAQLTRRTEDEIFGNLTLDTTDLHRSLQHKTRHDDKRVQITRVAPAEHIRRAGGAFRNSNRLS